MKLTIEEAREWYQIRDRVREAVADLEVCSRCGRVRDKANLVGTSRYYCCRPGDKNGCMAVVNNQ